ncbi:MAG: AmmeMemoRadiSam system radical SAM enzyme [Spirochaetales bacterium]|nr:AmmeMemoRadiSam system radical SAM enzyme [Spirochaetales bacterium]
MEARYYQKQDDQKIKCLLCPNKCLIAPGKTGVCGVRENDNGTLVLPFYGRLSALALDPIEKKPLYHFYPGSTILSAGFWGCSLRCPFCQNYNISQTTNKNSDYISPEKLVNLAVERHSFGIAYTYSEPLIHLEYLIKTAQIAKKRGIKNVLVSNGYINPDPASEFLEYLDGANIDLKSFNPHFYKKELGGNLEDVKKFLSLAAGKISLEVTTLVIPTKNDSVEEIEEIAVFLASLSPDIPYHLSCYYPTYQYTLPRTTAGSVSALAEHARKYLHYVYLGNVGFNETNTYCPSCNNLLIQRRGYDISVRGIKDGKCTACSGEIPIPGIDS